MCACERKKERERGGGRGNEGEEGMELSRKRDAKGETQGREVGVEGCKESPSWQTGRSSACANIFRVRFLRVRVENSASEGGDEATIKTGRRERWKISYKHKLC